MSTKKPAAGKKTAAAKVGAGKRVAALPTAGTGKAAKTAAAAPSTFHDVHDHLFSNTKRIFSIGRDIPPKRDLTRFVRWPRYVRLQRQRAILKKRLKVPAAINQFSRALDKNQASNLFRLLAHYRPESSEEKNSRLKARAAEEAKGNAAPQKSEKPMFVKQGLNHVTNLIEAKKAKLVVIAHDVEPMELVVWLPALCRKMNIPYCIVKGKARLGHLVYKKTTSVVAITDIRREDQSKLDQLVANIRIQFNDNVASRRVQGGGIVGPKAQHVIRKRERTAAKEASAKLK